MMMVAVSTIAILATIPALSELYLPFLGSARRGQRRPGLGRVGARSSAVLTLVVSAGAMAVWVLASLMVRGVTASPLWMPTAALAALAGFLTSLPVRDVTSRPAPVVAYSLGWTVLVFVPLALIMMFPARVGLDAAAGPVDLGGALPVHVAVGASALALLFARRRLPQSGPQGVVPPRVPLLSSGLVLWIVWAIGLVGMELALDGISGLIAVDSIVAPLAAVVGWALVERLRTTSVTASGVVAGLVCGLVSITPGSGFLSPVWAVITGATAGIVCAVFVYQRVASSGRRTWFLVGAHLVAAAIGLGYLGLSGTGFGFIFTGQLSVLLTQIGGCVLVVVWAGGVSLLLWPLARRLAPRRVTGRRSGGRPSRGRPFGRRPLGGRGFGRRRS
jgi:hypothetical protein